MSVKEAKSAVHRFSSVLKNQADAPIYEYDNYNVVPSHYLHQFPLKKFCAKKSTRTVRYIRAIIRFHILADYLPYINRVKEFK